MSDVVCCVGKPPAMKVAIDNESYGETLATAQLAQGLGNLDLKMTTLLTHHDHLTWLSFYILHINHLCSYLFFITILH